MSLLKINLYGSTLFYRLNTQKTSTQNHSRTSEDKSNTLRQILELTKTRNEYQNT